MVEPGVVGEWSVKEVLAHLVEWEQMVVGWYRVGHGGEVPELPAPGYKWNQTPPLNQMLAPWSHLDQGAIDFALKSGHLTLCPNARENLSRGVIASP